MARAPAGHVAWEHNSVTYGRPQRDGAAPPARSERSGRPRITPWLPQPPSVVSTELPSVTSSRSMPSIEMQSKS